MNKKTGLYYEKVADLLRNRIQSESYPVNTKIPSEDSLARELDYSRPTIKRAIDLLEGEGLVRCRPTVGTFVVKKTVIRHTIGYIPPTLTDPFHAEVIRELDSNVKSLSGSILVAEGGRSLSQYLNAIERLKKNGATGIILSDGEEDWWKKMRKTNIPCIWCGGIPASPEVDRISINDASSISVLLSHLAEIGVKSVGYAGSGQDAFCSRDRYSHFRDLMGNYGLHTESFWNFLVNDPGEAGGRKILSQFLYYPPLPDAIVCYNDWTAIGLIKEALANGIQVPRQLKVTGFDNLLLGRYFQIPLTTIDYQIPLLVKTALELLMRRIRQSNKPPETILIEGVLQTRSSTVENNLPDAAADF